MEKIKLGNCATYINGYAFKPTDWKKSGIPIIRIQDLTKSNSNPNYYDGKLDEKYIIKNGDVLISWSGSLGVYEWNGDIAYLNQHIFKVKFDKKEINKNYFIYLVESKIHEMLKNVHGSTMKHITKSNFDNIDINLHTINEQEEIANKITAVKDVINIRKEQLENLEQLVKSQFVEMFGNIYDNKNNYSIKELDYYTSLITYGLTIRPKFIEKGIDLISAREINTGIIDYDKAPKISEDDYNNLSEKAKPKKNEILFSKTGTIGLCAIIEDERKFAITQNAARIVTKDNINPLWLLYYLRTDEIQNYCKRQAKGNAVKDFQIQDMKKIPILDCPISIQNEFVEKVKLIDKQKFEIEKSLKEMEELYDSLMEEYFG